MTKKHLLLLTALFGMQLSFAQNSTQRQLPLLSNSNRFAAKPTAATASRVIAYHVRSSDGATYVSSDSIMLTYTGTRGGDLAHQPIKFDLGTSLAYNGATMTWGNNYISSQTFDANNNITSRLQKTWNTGSGTYINEYNDLYTNDANNNRTVGIAQNWNTGTSSWDNDTKDFYTYDADHHIISNTTQKWDAVNSVWVNDSKITNDYLNGDLNENIYQSWDVNNTWHNVNRETYTYDANHNILTKTEYTWTAVWSKTHLTTNTIGPNNEIESQVIQDWDGNTSQWVNAGRNDFTNFIGTNPQLEIDKTWDAGTSSYVNSKRTMYTYNSYGQYLSIMQDKWNAGGFWQAVSGNMHITFKYEEYATDVKELSSLNGTAALYPVPATDKLNIDINWNEAQPFSVNIFDMQGRSVNSWQVTATQSYHKAIAVNELPFGTYFIKIDGAKGHIYKQLIVSPK